MCNFYKHQVSELFSIIWEFKTFFSTLSHSKHKWIIYSMWYLWSKYNACICIQENSGCVFLPKTSSVGISSAHCDSLGLSDAWGLTCCSTSNGNAWNLIKPFVVVGDNRKCGSRGLAGPSDCIEPSRWGDNSNWAWPQQDHLLWDFIYRRWTHAPEISVIVAIPAFWIVSWREC